MRARFWSALMDAATALGGETIGVGLVAAPMDASFGSNK
jgi:hypothetical protein